MASIMSTTKTRKPHKKSRTGCLPCKARHVKCDEQKPDCVNCDKYGTKCEYPKSKKATSSDVVLSPTTMSTPSSSGSLAPNHSTSGTLPLGSQDLVLSIPSMRLLHHFTLVTANTLASEAGSEDVFSSYLVKLGFDYPFLLHAILSLAALHLSRLERGLREDYLLQAEKHHDAALMQFRAEVKDIDAANFQAVLIFASTLFPYSCAIPIDSSSDLEHAFASILSNFILIRSVRPMVNGVYDAMRESELGRIVPKDTEDVQWDSQDPPAETELVQLRKFSEAIHHLYPADIVKAYRDAIRILESIFERLRISPNPPSTALLKVWVHFLTPRFMELLSEKQPGALIIFAHYGVLFARGRRYWFVEGVAEQILCIADTFVPAEWRSWLDWPKEQILEWGPSGGG